MKEPPTHPADPVDELITMIAHDLRSPITAVKGFSQLALRQSDIPPRIRDYMTVTIKETDRMATLIDDLVLASQVDHQRPVRMVRAAVSDVLELAVQRSRRLDSTTSVRIADDEPDVIIACDPALTARAVALMIQTAQRYCVRSRAITLGTRCVAGQVVIGVWPNSKLTDKKLVALRRVVGTANGAPNDELSPSGLGLYICRRLIEVQAGRVWIDQPPNGSTRFMMMLPGQTSDREISPRGDRPQWS